MPTAPPIKVPILGVDLYSKEFKEMTKRAQKMGKAVQSVGRKMSMYVTAPIIAGGVASVKLAKDINESMASVGTLIPGQTKRLLGLKKAVQDLAVETGVSAMTISEGLYETISAFGDAEDPVNKLTIATKMSKAGMSSVKEALGLVSAVTKGYGDTSDAAAQRASDLAFQTVKLGQTTFPDLAASIGKVVPLATTLNVKQEELFGSMATLTGVTGTASEVSTQMASALGAVIKPSSDMTKAAKKLGYESGIAMIKEIGLQESIKKLGEVTGGSEEKLGKLFTRKEGLNAVLTLLGPQADSFNEKIAAMGNVAGSTEQAFKEQTEGINKDGHAWDQTTQRGNRAMVALGDKLLPVVTKLTDRLIPFIDKIASASESELEFGIKAAAAAAAFGPLLIGVGKMIAIYPTAIKFATLYGARLGLVTLKTKSATVATKQAAIQQQIYDGKLKASNMTFKQSVAAMGKVNSALSVLAAGAFGWEVGTLIYNNLVEPLQDAVNLMNKASAISDDLNQMGTGAYSGGALKQQRKTLSAALREEKSSFWVSDNIVKNLETQIGNIDTQLKINEMRAMRKALDTSPSILEGEGGRLDEAALLDAIARNKTESESKIKIEFENLPAGATPKVTRQRGAKVEAEGAIMAGAI